VFSQLALGPIVDEVATLQKDAEAGRLECPRPVAGISV
jgi:hypothetical protein